MMIKSKSEVFIRIRQSAEEKKREEQMDLTSRPVDLKNVDVTDEFWKEEMELVRNEVIPYQWNALNDRIPDAAPSYAIHNFKAASLLQEKKRARAHIEYPPYESRIQVLPEDPDHPEEDRFYGFVFQDSDLYKWLEAAACSLAAHPDEALEKTADEVISLISSAQEEDGYLNTFYILNGRERAFSNLRDHHELYCFGHLAEAAAAYYQATGKDELLHTAERYAELICRVFGNGDGQKKGYPGHEIAEMALVRLYEVTGKKEYLELSSWFINERGQNPCYFDSEKNGPYFLSGKEEKYSYFQAHKPVREQKEAVGHAVRAMYLYSGMADIARHLQDESLKEACRDLFRSTVREKMYITGAVGGTEIGEAFSYPFDLQNDTAYAETCASIGLIFFARRMLQLEPKAEYADVMEKALYNTVLSGMALDGKSFFYVNPLEVYPRANRTDTRISHVKTVRQ